MTTMAAIKDAYGCGERLAFCTHIFNQKEAMDICQASRSKGLVNEECRAISNYYDFYIKYYS